jgi:transposase-like protein
MKCTTRWLNWSRESGSMAHALAAVGLIILAVMGIVVESSGGWITNAPVVIVAEGEDRRGREERHRVEFEWRAGWGYLKRSWWVALARSEGLMMVAVLSDRQEWEWVSVLPWGVWLWRGLGVSCPWLVGMVWYRVVGRVGEEVSRLVLIGLGLEWVRQQRAIDEGLVRILVAAHKKQVAMEQMGWMRGEVFSVTGLVIGAVGSETAIEVEQDEGGWYQVRFKEGERVLFELHIDGEVEFYKRMLIIFLGLLEVPGEGRGSRRTRDGRTPMVRQQQMEEWFGERQPVISRWMGYWLKQDWRRLLSMYAPAVLTLEVQQRIIETWAKFPWWGADRLLAYLQEQGEELTGEQVRQAGRESGWNVLRAELKRVYTMSAESIRPRDEWLVSQLLTQIQGLVKQLEAVGGLTPEQRIEIKDLETLCEEVGVGPALVQARLPWVLRLEHVLFGHWEPVGDESVRCIYCGSTHVARKSRRGRQRKYVDETGQEHIIEVYRFYCLNPACKYKSFTNLPPNLIPYSKWVLEQRLAALQSYEWMRSVYRCTGQVLGVSKVTAYHWVIAFGYELLPVAALFGVVRSSGVVGVDEKYVLVPKNDKPHSKMKRWMYVYFAVDCYTYDLLHIDIYPYNDHVSATAFLLALRAKGYHPQVIITDLRQDYASVIASVFPAAIHHECIFHALQQVHKYLKDAYGKDYAETQPDVNQLRQDIDAIFDTHSKRIAQQRYQAVLAQHQPFAPATPAFDLLESHWPKLVNAIESDLIPTTNNATEQVIRIFTQHYKTFCGFESIHSARAYLAVFEKGYRFTPFSIDAQKRIRGKCPLELAGYEVDKLPMSQLFRGFALQWPAGAFKELVPCV